MMVGCRTLVSVMVVMPTLAKRENAEQPVVAGVIVRLVSSITEQMRGRINCPRKVPDDDSTDEHAPDEPTKTRLQPLAVVKNIPPASTYYKYYQRVGEINDQKSVTDVEPAVEVITPQIASKLLQVVTIINRWIVGQHPAHVGPEKADHLG